MSTSSASTARLKTSAADRAQKAAGDAGKQAAGMAVKAAKYAKDESVLNRSLRLSFGANPKRPSVTVRKRTVGSKHGSIAWLMRWKGQWKQGLPNCGSQRKRSSGSYSSVLRARATYASTVRLSASRPRSSSRQIGTSLRYCQKWQQPNLISSMG